MLKGIINMELETLYHTLFESEIDAYGDFLIKNREKYKNLDSHEAFKKYSESSPYEQSQHWFAYHTILMSELDCIWAGEQRHREEAHTQNLLTALKKNSEILNLKYQIKSNTSEVNKQGFALMSVDLQRGQEAKSGGDFALVLEIENQDVRKFYPMVIQAKRLSKNSVDLTRQNSNGSQIEVLHNNKAASCYLYFSETSKEFKTPYPPVLKKSSDLIEKKKFLEKDTSPYEKSELLTEVLLGAFYDGYESIHEALSQITGDIFHNDITALYVLTEQREKRIIYQKLQSLLLEREELYVELERLLPNTIIIEDLKNMERKTSIEVQNQRVKQTKISEQERAKECIDKITTINNISVVLGLSKKLFPNKILEIEELIVKCNIDEIDNIIVDYEKSPATDNDNMVALNNFKVRIKQMPRQEKEKEKVKKKAAISAPKKQYR